jgi:PIN domain nuclease of toxin-antitoxin system
LNLLLDSHVLLWWPIGSPRLGAEARALIEDQENRLFMSAASWWELGLKRSLGKLDADLPAIRRTLEQRDVGTILVTLDHGEAEAALPVLHRDPFDHMLVVQAQVEGMRLLTRDARLKTYGSSVLCT